MLCWKEEEEDGTQAAACDCRELRPCAALLSSFIPSEHGALGVTLILSKPSALLNHSPCVLLREMESAEFPLTLSVENPEQDNSVRILTTACLERTRRGLALRTGLKYR